MTHLLLLLAVLQSPIVTDWREQVAACQPVVEVPAGIHHFSTPLVLCDYPMTLRGSGIGATELIFASGDGIIAHRKFFNGPITIERLTISSSARRGGTALTVTYPKVSNAMDTTLLVRDVQIRPSNEGSWLGWRGGGWTRGVALQHAWGAEFTNLQIAGNNLEVSAATLRDPTLQVGVDIGDSMGVTLHSLKIANVGRGVQSIVDAIGRAEGLVVDGGYIINCNVGIWAEAAEGVLVPSLYLNKLHIYAMTHGVVAIGRSAVGISESEISQSHLADPQAWFFGLYLRRSEYVRVSTTAFWRGLIRGAEHMGTGIVAIDAHNSVVGDNVFAEGLQQSVWLLSSTSGWRGTSNRFASPQGVINQGRDNRVE